MLIKISQISWNGTEIEPIYVNPDNIVMIKSKSDNRNIPKPFFEIILYDNHSVYTYEIQDLLKIYNYCGDKNER